jgi:DNA-binding response OmpR family regulator
VENKKMKLYVSYSDIVSFVKNICEESFSILMKRKNISFSFITDPPKISGYFDRDKLDKILFNLLSNAFKYTPENKSVRLQMQTYVSGEHEYLKIRVEDEGKGISQKEQAQIFVRFYNNKFNDVGASNGIGLSLTKELVELHHGTIEVHSLLGQGTSFVVNIPIDKVSYTPEELKEVIVGQEPDVVRLEEEGDGNINGRVKQTDDTLLLVEDNMELLLLMESVFSQTYQVAKAENGKEALDYLRNNQVDIVISDIMMPQMDGLELCRQIKSDITTSHIIVVLLTAQTSVDTQIGSYKEGADDYISKPFEPKILKARLDNLLEKRKKLQTALKKNGSYPVSQTGLISIDEQFVEKAVQYVEQNLTDANLDVGTLADYFHMSRSTLLRKIKAITGLSPSDFIKRIKMQCAGRMLKNKSTNISDVIIAVGYNDHKHFTTSFKEIFGITPSEYQKQNR